MDARRLIRDVLVIVVALGSYFPGAYAVELPMTYQGQLKQDGVPVNGVVYLEFGLWDALDSGAQVGWCYWTQSGVEVVNGLFTVEVDAIEFGPEAFNGEPRWLQIAVTDDQGMNPIELSPRQAITPAPYALYAFDGAGGGGSLWGSWGSDIYYTDGYVGIGEEWPWAPLTVISPGDSEAVVADNWGEGTSATLAGMGSGVSGYAMSPDGAGVYGSNMAAGAGVWGHTSNPDGYAGFFTGRGYFTDEVGLGRIPTTKLDVAGTVRMDGFQLTDSPMFGYVLTADETGVGTWQPAGGGGGSLWTTDAEGINYQAGNVGIGTPSDSVARLNVDSGGQQAIHAHNSNSSAQTFALYAEADSTLARTVFGDATATSGATVGVFGRSKSPDGYGVFGDAYATTGSAIGVYGRSECDNGYGGYFITNGNQGYGVYAEAETASSGYAGYFVGRGYFSSNVGIGTASPMATLDVAGGIRANSVQLTTGATNGHVLTSDASGSATWQAPSGGGESLWQTNGSEIYYDADNVGVGVSDPQSTLHVAGGNWDVSTTEGDFKIGSSTYRLKMGVATSGDEIGHSRIFAGGPSSKLTLGANGQDRLTVTSTYVGIGTTSPTEDLDVAGTVKMTGFKLTNSPITGYVLKCDSAGNGTWQPGGGGGFELPYEGSISSTSPAFKITNSGTGMSSHAISARINNAASHGDAAAGYFSAGNSNGYAIYATADGTAIRANCAETVGNAIYGSSSGNGGAYFTCTAANGYGVKGVAHAISGIDTTGGWFESASPNGRAVYAYTDGDTASSVHAQADGVESTAVKAVSSWNAIVATGGVNAAKFYGDVRVYGGGSVIFHVDEDDGTTSVDVLQIMGGSDLAENFDVTEQDAQPGTVVEIDPDNPGKLRVARGAYNRRVAGVISGANELDVGMVLADLPGAENSMPVALSGRVWVHCDATQMAIEPGDLLTTAERAGHAMPVRDFDRAHGAVIGKAMSRLTQGETGMVLVLVNLQ
jgi:hypothetical protein